MAKYPTFPNPEFLHHPEKNEHLAYSLFVEMLEKDFLEIKDGAEEKIKFAVRDMCEMIFQMEKLLDEQTEINRELRSQNE